MENITLRLDLLNDGRIVPLCYLTPEEKTIRVDRTLNYTTMQNEDNSLSHIITCRCGTRKINSRLSLPLLDFSVRLLTTLNTLLRWLE